MLWKISLCPQEEHPSYQYLFETPKTCVVCRSSNHHIVSESINKDDESSKD